MCLPPRQILRLNLHALMFLFIADVFSNNIWSHFLRPTSHNSVLTGSNYMRAFHDAERTNKVRMEPDCNELPLWCMVALWLALKLQMGWVPPAHQCSCRWHDRYLLVTNNQPVRTVILMLWCKYTVCHSTGVSGYIRCIWLSASPPLPACW